MLSNIANTYKRELLRWSFSAILKKSSGDPISLKVAQKNTSVSAISDAGLLKSPKMVFVIERTQLGADTILRHDVLIVENIEYAIDSVVPYRIDGSTVAYEVTVNE